MERVFLTVLFLKFSGNLIWHLKDMDWSSVTTNYLNLVYRKCTLISSGGLCVFSDSVSLIECLLRCL